MYCNAAAPPRGTYLCFGGIFASHLALLRDQATEIPTDRVRKRNSKVSEPPSLKRGLLLYEVQLIRQVGTPRRR